MFLFMFDNLVGIDLVGYVGLEDGVDWYWDCIFVGVVLIMLLGVGVELVVLENC